MCAGNETLYELCAIYMFTVTLHMLSCVSEHHEEQESSAEPPVFIYFHEAGFNLAQTRMCERNVIGPMWWVWVGVGDRYFKLVL